MEDKLTLFFNATNYSENLYDYSVDTVTEAFTGGGFIYVGYDKPINSIYVELSTPSATPLSISLDVFTTSFVTKTFNDRTKGLSRSGFITWDRSTGTEKKTTVNGVNLYWYRITVPQPAAALVFKGINVVFADDNDLKEEFPTLTDYYPTGQTSFIVFHQAVRKHIIQTLRNRGRTIATGPGNSGGNSNNATRVKFDQWDLLDVEEIRQAAKFMALHKIFSWLSDSPDDKWKQKADEAYSNYGQQIDTFYLSVDDNNDGVAQSSEIQAVDSVRIVRA